MKYKNIVFDVGHVLLSYRWKEMMVDYGYTPEEAEAFYQMTCRDPLWAEFDLENWSFQEVVDKFIEKNPSHADAIRYFFNHKSDMSLPRPGVYQRCEKLVEQGYRLYILSNYSSVLFAEHTKNISIMDKFSGMMVSYMIHIGKPDRRIYEALYREYGIDPADSLFYDDREENIEASKKSGMDAILVESEEMLERSLDKLLEQK